MDKQTRGQFILDWGGYGVRQSKAKRKAYRAAKRTARREAMRFEEQANED